MHIHEDTSKPENRVNLTLFHLLMNNEIKNMITEKLGLKSDCVIYPASGLITEDFILSYRPDFEIQLGKEIIGYIEVELGKDSAQVKKYEESKRKDIKIYSIYGKKEYGGDLSLEEIYNFINSKKQELAQNAQEELSMDLLLELIKHYVICGNFNINNKRTLVSDEAKKTKIIQAFYDSIEDKKIIDDNSSFSEGHILIDSTSDSGDGYSIRVYSSESNKKHLSIMARSSGRNQIEFPSYKKMVKYLPYNKQFVEDYTNLLKSLGANSIREKSEKEKVIIPLQKVEENIYDIISLIKESFLQNK